MAKEKPIKKARKKAGVLARIIEERLVVEPEKVVRLGVWAVGTIVCHNLNLGGFITWLGESNQYIDTGLPYPFDKRIKFPWEKNDSPTLEDKVCEWGIPAITSWLLVYHPEAVAKFVDALIPF